jgi:hypothetical protein
VTPLQKVAMGLVVVFLSARFSGYDALPDPVGWGLVVAGLLPLRTRIPLGGWALALAVVAGLVAVPLVLPILETRLTPSGQWGASLPQTLFCVVLCTSLCTVAERAGEREAVRFGLLRWAFVAVASGPVLVYGGGVDALTTPVAVLAVLANVALVYYLFTVSRRGYGGTEASAAPGQAGDA